MSTPFSEGIADTNGTITITVPFVINEGEEIVSSLTISGEVSITAVHSSTESLHIYALFSEILREETTVSTSLSAMDEPTETCTVRNCLLLGCGTKILNELTQHMQKTSEIRTTIGDFGIQDTLGISIPIGQTNLSKALDVRLPQSTGFLIKDNLTVYADGADVTALFKSGVISLFGNNKPLSIDAVFKPLKNVPKAISIHINEERYTFITESSTSSPERCGITGVLENKNVSIEPSIAKASELCADESDIIFASQDFMTSDICGDMAEHDLAAMLADMSGTYARQMADGRSMVYKIDKHSTSYTPDHILSWEKISAANSIGSVEVIYGKNGDNYITLEPLTKKAQKQTKLKVYGKSGIPVRADGGVSKVISRGNKEVVTENVIFEKGRGKLAKPCTKMLTSGISADGKNITAESGCISTSITYETSYDLYEISANSGDMTICAYLENRVVLLNGDGEQKSISAENICDHVTAYRLAKGILDRQGSKLNLLTTHSNIINTTNGINVECSAGSGALISASININTNPVKITDRLEVLSWQR